MYHCVIIWPSNQFTWRNTLTWIPLHLETLSFTNSSKPFWYSCKPWHIPKVAAKCEIERARCQIYGGRKIPLPQHHPLWGFHVGVLPGTEAVDVKRAALRHRPQVLTSIFRNRNVNELQNYGNSCFQISLERMLPFLILWMLIAVVFPGNSTGCLKNMSHNLNFLCCIILHNLYELKLESF